jgi:hypothetical protein
MTLDRAGGVLNMKQTFIAGPDESNPIHFPPHAARFVWRGPHAGGLFVP